MGEVVHLPGVFCAKLEEAIPVSKVLASAMDLGLKDVVYVGRAITGEIIVGGSQPDADAAIGLLTRGITSLVTSEQVHLETENPTG